MTGDVPTPHVAHPQCTHPVVIRTKTIASYWNCAFKKTIRAENARKLLKVLSTKLILQHLFLTFESHAGAVGLPNVFRCTVQQTNALHSSLTGLVGSGTVLQGIISGCYIPFALYTFSAVF